MEGFKAFVEHLREERAACLAKSAALEADGRGDEARLERVRGNIFEVMATTAGVAEARFSTDPAGFFAERLDSIPRAWRTALDEAERHGDHDRAATERVKLQAAADIGVLWAAAREGGQ